MPRPKPPQPYLNKRHPRSRGLVLAYPLNHCIGHGTREVSGRHEGFRDVPYNGGSTTPADRWQLSQWGEVPHFFGTSGLGNQDTRLEVGELDLGALKRMTISAIWRYTGSQAAEDKNAQTVARTSNNTAATTDYALGGFDSGGTRFGPIFSFRNSASGGAGTVARLGTLVTDTWYHAVGQNTGSFLYLFHQGRFVNLAGGGGTLTEQSGRELNIGATKKTTGYASILGEVAGVWIWDRVLTPKEVYEHYLDPFAMHRDTSTRSAYFFTHTPMSFEPIDGTAAATSGSQSDLTAQLAMDGTIAATSGASATASLLAELAGALAGTSGQASDLSAQFSIAGTAAGTAGSSVALSLAAALDGVSAASSGNAATMQVVVGLDGTAAATSGHSAALEIVIELAGSSAGTSGETTDLSILIGLDGAAPGTSGHAAALAMGVTLEGSAPGTSGHSTDVTVIAALNGTAAGSSGQNATLGLNFGIAGTAASASGSSALIQILRGLEGSAAGLSGHSVNLTMGEMTLSGTIASVSGHAADLTLEIELDGTIAANSGHAATLFMVGTFVSGRDNDVIIPSQGQFLIPGHGKIWTIPAQGADIGIPSLGHWDLIPNQGDWDSLD